MSWYGGEPIEHSVVGKVVIKFTCPRCDKEQEKELDLGVDSCEFSCTNPICGRHNTTRFEFAFSFDGSYKGNTDVPLLKEKL